jgi:hypothetical protein
VSSSSRARVVVELETDGDPIRGSTSSAGQPERPFRGWLELAHALEAARLLPESGEQRSSDEPAPVSTWDAAPRHRKN